MFWEIHKEKVLAGIIVLAVVAVVYIALRPRTPPESGRPTMISSAEEKAKPTDMEGPAPTKEPEGAPPTRESGQPETPELTRHDEVPTSESSPESRARATEAKTSVEVPVKEKAESTGAEASGPTEEHEGKPREGGSEEISKPRPPAFNGVFLTPEGPLPIMGTTEIGTQVEVSVDGTEKLAEVDGTKWEISSEETKEFNLETGNKVTAKAMRSGKYSDPSETVVMSITCYRDHAEVSGVPLDKYVIIWLWAPDEMTKPEEGGAYYLQKGDIADADRMVSGRLFHGKPGKDVIVTIHRSEIPREKIDTWIKEQEKSPSPWSDTRSLRDRLREKKCVPEYVSDRVPIR